MTCFLIRLARRFMSDRRGNVAMIVALCAVPLFGMLGFAIDYGIALSDKSKLDNAADAATLAAINAAQAVLQSQGSTATSAAQAAGQTAGNAAFMANAGRLAFISNYPAPTLNVTATFPTVAATLSLRLFRPDEFKPHRWHRNGSGPRKIESVVGDERPISIIISWSMSRNRWVSAPPKRT